MKNSFDMIKGALIIMVFTLCCVAGVVMFTASPAVPDRRVDTSVAETSKASVVGFDKDNLNKVNKTKEAVNIFDVKNALAGIRRLMNSTMSPENKERIASDALDTIENNRKLLNSEQVAVYKNVRQHMKYNDKLVYDDYVNINTLLDVVLKNLIVFDEYESFLASLSEIPANMSDEEIEEMIESDNATIIGMDQLYIGEDDFAELEVKDEVVEEAGVDSNVYENSSLSFGIDVSHYQNEAGIDWAKVKESGIDFAIVKCGGRSVSEDAHLYEDKSFVENIEGALANGIQVGAYFFSQATSVKEAFEEASFCVNLLKKYKLTYPVAFDWEAAAGYRVNNVSLDKSQMNAIVSTFCDTIKANGFDPCVYFCRNDWDNLVDAASLTSKYKTWLALYHKEFYYKDKLWKLGDKLAEFDYPYQLWQYGISNAVSGVDGYVDVNVAFFRYDNYVANTLSEPFLNVINTEINITLGDDYNLLTGVSAKNCLGYDPRIICEIMNATGETVEYKNLTEGSYIVNYYFKDPKAGIISKSASLKAVASARIMVDALEYSIYTGTIFNVYEGVRAYDSYGKQVDVSIAIMSGGNQVTVLDTSVPGVYDIVYSFEDERLGKVSKTVKLTVKEK